MPCLRSSRRVAAAASRAANHSLSVLPNPQIWFEVRPRSPSTRLGVGQRKSRLEAADAPPGAAAIAPCADRVPWRHRFAFAGIERSCSPNSPTGHRGGAPATRSSAFLRALLSWSPPALRPATDSTSACRCRGTRSQLRRSRRSCERRLRLGNHPRDDLRGRQHLMDAAGALARPRHDLVHVSCLDRCLQDIEEASGIPAR